MNWFKYFTIFVLAVSCFSLSAQLEQQKFNLEHKLLKQQAEQQDEQLTIPQWLTSKGQSQLSKQTFKSPAARRETLDLKLNGEDQTTIIQGEDIVVTLYFSDDCFTADIEIWADMNANGTWEEAIDFYIPDTAETVHDNDADDEDPQVGVYQYTLAADEEGPNLVADLGMLFLAADTGGFDEAFVYIDPMISNYSVAGSVTPAAANLIVMAVTDDAMWMCTTNANGNYQNFVAEEDYYFIMAFDPLGILNGMFSTTVYENININGHLTGYDFSFEPGNATIEGTLTDTSGNPLQGILIYADQDGPTSIWAETDNSGFYSLSVIEGEWYVEPSWDDLIPNYMAVEEVEVFVEEGEVEVVDFSVYESDANVTGMVYLDGLPADGFEIEANNYETGHSAAESQMDGSYVLPLSSAANNLGGYDVMLDIWDMTGVYVEEVYNSIPTGSANIDFHVYTANAGLEGYIYDSVTMEPLEDAWIHAADSLHSYGIGPDEDGYYILYLPNGTYDVWVGSDMYYQQYLQEVVVEDEFVNLDFYLDPISYEGALEGFVYETGTTDPVEGVDIFVYNDIFWNNTTTDENGYYYFDMPNGNFQLNAQHPDFYPYFQQNVIINNNTVQQDIYLDPVIFEGTLEGHVYIDGTTTPVAIAYVEVYSDLYWTETYTDASGFFSIDLPNGIYELNCWQVGYLNTYIDNIEIMNNTVTLDIYLIPNVEADPLLTAPTKLLQNYPNPFNPSTTISFTLTTEITENTELVIYNLNGQKVKQLVSEQLSAGQHLVVWEGKDENNQPVSSGIYFYKLKAENYEKTRKMILIK